MDTINIEVGQIYKYANGKTITVTYVGSESVTFVNRNGRTRAFALSYLRSNQCPLTFVGVDELAVQTKDQRIKELEGTVLDLQSELARKKYSLTVACNRVEELEDKLKIAASALRRVDNIAYEIDNKVINDIACNALEQLGELK